MTAEKILRELHTSGEHRFTMDELLDRVDARPATIRKAVAQLARAARVTTFEVGDVVFVEAPGAPARGIRIGP